MSENTCDWRNCFLGREAELKWLMDAWELSTSGAGPQMRVLYAESGFGKTKLAQRFYTELSRKHDSEGYWPDTLLHKDNDLKVMPLFGQANSTAEVPWFWYGLRWPDEPKKRNENSTHDVFTEVYESRFFTVHEEAVLRRVNSRKRVSKAIFCLGKAGLNIASGGLFEFTQSAFEAYEGIKDVLPLGKEEREANKDKSREQRDLESEQGIIQKW